MNRGSGGCVTFFDFNFVRNVKNNQNNLWNPF